MLDKFFKYTLWDKFLNNDQKKKKERKSIFTYYMVVMQSE